MKLPEIPEMLAQQPQIYEGAGQSYLGWVLAGVTTIIATLAGAVASLRKRELTEFDKRESGLIMRITTLEAEYEKSRAEIRDCHKQREEIRVELASVKTRLEIVEQRLPCSTFANTEKNKNA
jgi:septal ring factor EnvC (AmiA/AmiB activator)